MKRVIVAAAIAGILVLMWQVWVKHEAHREQEQAAQAKRDAAYHAELARFQRDLQLGMPRSEVDKYLDAHQLPYLKMAQEIPIDIGRDPGDGWVCDYWRVYIDLRFSRPKDQSSPSAEDTLNSISLQRIGHCM